MIIVVRLTANSTKRFPCKRIPLIRCLPVRCVSRRNSLRQLPCLFIHDCRKAVFYQIFRQFSVVSDLLMCDRVCNACLLKQAVTAVLLISDNVLNGGLCPGSTGHSSWHPFGNKPVGDFAVAIAVNEVLVYLPHQFSFILHNGHDTLVLSKTVRSVERDAPRNALLIPSSLAPFYVCRHRFGLGLGKRSHQCEHEFAG